MLKSGCLVWPAEIQKAEAGNAEIQWLGLAHSGSEISIYPRYVIVNQALDRPVRWCVRDVIVRMRDLNVFHAVRSKTKSPYVKV